MGIVQPTGYIQQTSPPSYLGFTTGSTIYLDAKKTTSYPGSGSIWYDLSGNGLNGSISGSVSFINGGTGNANYFSYPNGTGSLLGSIIVNSALGNLAQTGSITIGGWCKTTVDNSMTGSAGYGIIPMYSYGVSAAGNFNQGLTSNIEYTNTTNSRLYGRFYGGGGVAYPISTDGFFYNYNSKWLHLMAQWYYSSITPVGNGNIRLFVNGTLKAIDGESGAIGGDRKCRVGYNSNDGANTTTFYNGSFSTLEVYQKVLTNDEIYNNFYVSKSFYGY